MLARELSLSRACLLVLPDLRRLPFRGVRLLLGLDLGLPRHRRLSVRSSVLVLRLRGVILCGLAK